MADQGLAPAGSSTYSSNTLHVGDGTWDASRDSFLLPNIVGLNFDTMRYNGMGNRFRGLSEYHTIITAHGVLAAITFLGVVPAAILIASFYYQNPRLALRIHITLQIMTVILTTVVFILGYFAVGPERSLTNPHHGIGVAIYVLVLIQAIGGALIHKIEKGKMRYHIPLKLMLHQWMGRAIALLALAQIPIGLTLYGSPKALFVLYTLVMAALFFLYFVLTYQRHKRAAYGSDEQGSYVSGTDGTSQSGSHHHRGRFGTLAGAAAGGLGIAALRRRFSNRERGGERIDDRRTDVSGVSGSGMHSRVDSSSYLSNEKYSHDGRKDHTWRNRILGGAAGVGAIAGMRKLFDRRKDRERDDEYRSEVSTTYRPPLGGPVTSSIDHVDRLEAGDAVYEGDARSRRVEDRERAQAQAGRPGVLGRDDDSFGEYSSDGGREHRGGGAGALAGIAGAVGLGGWLERRRSKKEQARVDAQRQQEMEEERLYRPSEQQPLYPGDGTPVRNGGGVRFDPNLPGNSVANQQNQQPPPQPSFNVLNQGPPPPGPFQNHPYGQQPPIANIPPPPMAGPPRNMPPHQQAYNTDGPPPPLPPAHRSGATSNTSYSDRQSPDRRGPNTPYISNIVTNTVNTPGPNPMMSGPPRGPTEPPPVASPPRHRRLSGQSSISESPAVSLRVKPSRDGRHVTVQQLSPEQAAARRGQRQSSTSGPVRSPLGQDTGAPLSAQSTGPQFTDAGQAPSELHLPEARQGQPGLSAAGSSPGSAAQTAGGGYETGGSYEDRRRRRRAERARQQGDVQGSSGGRVGFA